MSLKETIQLQFRLPTIMVNWWKELIFLIPVALLAFFGLKDQLDVLQGVLTTLALGSITVYVAHLIRKIVFPEISIMAMYKKSLEAPLAAAVFFLAIIAFFAVVVNTLNFV